MQDELQHSCAPNGDDTPYRIVEPAELLFTCVPGHHMAPNDALEYWKQQAGVEAVNGSFPVAYNELGTLMSVTGMPACSVGEIFHSREVWCNIANGLSILHIGWCNQHAH